MLNATTYLQAAKTSVCGLLLVYGVVYEVPLVCGVLYYFVFVLCLMSWGPTGGQQTEFMQIHLAKILLLCEK